MRSPFNNLLKPLLIVLAIITAGCSLSPTTSQGLWLSPEQRQLNATINHWQISGKIGLLSDANSHTAYLNWQQCGQQFDIRLTGPLGQGAAHLYGNQQLARLQTKQYSYSADTPEQLLIQQGWAFPVSQLLYWVRGIPAPDLALLQQSSQGFEQMGWQLHFKQWHTINGYRLPKKATATHPELKLSLLLKNWQANTECSLSQE